MREGPGVSVSVFSLSGNQNPTWIQGGLDPTKGDFDWSEIDQSRSVGAETSYVPFFTPHNACFGALFLFGRLSTRTKCINLTPGAEKPKISSPQKPRTGKCSSPSERPLIKNPRPL